MTLSPKGYRRVGKAGRNYTNDPRDYYYLRYFDGRPYYYSSDGVLAMSSYSWRELQQRGWGQCWPSVVDLPEGI